MEKKIPETLRPLFLYNYIKFNFEKIILFLQKKKNSTENPDYLDIDSDGSNIRFEESFNVTNMSSSEEYSPEVEFM